MENPLSEKAAASEDFPEEDIPAIIYAPLSLEIALP